MKIEVQKLSLNHFKGIKSMEIEFSDMTSISGANATGKTTIMDAFLWLLFGKDSNDKKEFNIKTLDDKGEPIHQLDHSVKAVLSVDNDTITLERVYREKWPKKQGYDNVTFSGHETDYFINNVPCKTQSEYKNKVDGILDEGLFKLVTNPAYFPALNWIERRKVLIDIAGEVNDAEIAEKDDRFKELLSTLNGKKTIEEYKREIAAKKKVIRDELEMIPARVDEATRSMPEAVDVKSVNNEIASLEEQVKDIDKSIESLLEGTKSQQMAARVHQNEIFARQTSLIEIEQRIKNTLIRDKTERANLIEGKKNVIDSTSRTIKEKQISVKVYQEDIDVLSKDLDILRKEWDKINSESLTIDENALSCPACKRAYDQATIHETKQNLLKNFNEDKLKKLERLNQKGQQMVKAIDDKDNAIISIKAEIKKLEAQLPVLQGELESLAPDQEFTLEELLLDDTEYQEIKKQIVILQKEVLPTDTVDTSAQKAEKEDIQIKISDLRGKLTLNEVIEKTKARIVELKAKEKSLAKELTDLEGIEDTIREFTKAKIDAIESRVNGMFRFVKFRMFNILINGGEEEACDILVNGVPYPDANNAGRINAGVDIINTLSKHYNVSAPIWVDNAEAVNTIIPTESQLIQLIVTNENVLTVKN